MDYSPLWAGLLGALGAALLGWITGAWAWLWRLTEPMRTRRREQRNQQREFWAWAPTLREVTETTSEKVGRMTGAISAVEERLKAQDDVLREHSEALADTLAMTQGEFESSPVARFICDEDGRNIAVNSAYCALVGMSRDDMLGNRWRRVIHPDDLDRHLERFGDAREGHYEMEDNPRVVPPGRPAFRAHVHMIPHPRKIGPALRWHGTVVPVLEPA